MAPLPFTGGVAMKNIDRALVALAFCLSLAAGCGGSIIASGDGGPDSGGWSGGDGNGGPVDLSRNLNPDAACASVSAAANLSKKPVDIIFVIDNSGSMTQEIVAVQNNINKNFADIIAKSGLDYRVIMLSFHGSATADQSICITMPLSGNTTCAPPPNKPTNGARFFHYSVEIASTNSFAQILATYNKADQFNLAPTGWASWLRADAFKVFIEITDDNSGMTAANFEQQLLAKTPKMFGTTGNRNYQFYTIAGLKQNSPATKPWAPTDPLQTALCTNGGGAVANGIEYQRLSVATKGLRFPICEHASFDAVFQSVAMGVIAGAKVDCSFNVPTPPMGQTIDLASVLVAYTPSTGGGVQIFKQVADATQCAPDSFYLENKTRIILCPAACMKVQMDTKAEVNVLFDCESGIG
jgi:hypothetical protein